MQACLPGGNCTIPSPGDIFIPDWGNDFDTGITLPNWGSTPQDLRQLCNCLNNGMCSPECTYILPGELPFSFLSGKEDKQAKGTASEGTRCGDSNWRVQIHSQNSPRPAGWRSHHGVLSAWMRTIFGLTRYIEDNAPTILMPLANHLRTYGIQNKFIPGIGGAWADVSWNTMFSLSDLMLDDVNAANAPKDCQDEYWRRFKEYIKQLICQVATEALMYGLAQVTPTMIDMWNWAEGSPDVCEAMRSFTSV